MTRSAGAIIGQVIVERGIAARHRFQPVVEIEHHFVERQIVFHQRAVADVGQLLLLAAAVLAEFQHRAEIFVGRQDRRLDPGLVHFLDMVRVRHVDRIVDFQLLAVAQLDLVDHRRRGRDQVEIEFALEPLLDDFQMQQAEKAAAEAEAERGGGFHFDRRSSRR